jgi:hypothetical protein
VRSSSAARRSSSSRCSRSTLAVATTLVSSVDVLISQLYTSDTSDARMLIAVPEILPRFWRVQQQLDDLRKIARILEETGEVPDTARVAAGATAAGDPRRLRGLPAIGRNVSGSTVHTDPVRALLAKERRQ